MGGYFGKKTSEEKPEENPSPPQEATPTANSLTNPSGVVSSTGSTIESSTVRDE